MDAGAPGSRDMAPTRPGLPLPMEVVIAIVEHCEDFDWPYKDANPHPQYSAGLADFHYGDDYAVPWITIPPNAKRDICSIRLVCAQFKDASYASFGNILGDRRFRLTKTGLADLQGISANQRLAPCIKTLTFGTALVADCSDAYDVPDLLQEFGESTPNVNK